MSVLSSIYSVFCVGIDLQIFHTMGYNPVFCFVAQTVPALANGSSSAVFSVTLTYPYQCLFGLLLFLRTSLLSGTVSF